MYRAARKRSDVAATGVAVAIALCLFQEAPHGGLKKPNPADFDWTAPPAREQPPLAPAAEVEARYAHAWELVRAGDSDAALEDWLWLWSATDNKASAFEPTIRGQIIESIGQVAAHHEPTRVRFTAILDEVEAFIRRDPPQAFREWTDWADLSRAMKQEDRLVRLYEERRKPDGSLSAFAPLSKDDLAAIGGGRLPTKGNAHFHPYAFDDLFEVLVERGRFADAGRLYADLVGEAELKLKITDEGAEMVAGHLSDEEIEAERQQCREQVALLSALGFAADRTQQAEQVVAALLRRYDDAASRRALVLACHRVGVAPAAETRWIAEIRELGADTSDLEAAPTGVQLGPK